MKKEEELTVKFETLHEEVQAYMNAFMFKHNKTYGSLVSTILMIAHQLSMHAEFALIKREDKMSVEMLQTLLNIKNYLAPLDKEDEMLKKGYIKIEDLF